MTKKKSINIKGIAQLDKNKQAKTKGAGCGVIFGDGQILYCTHQFHNTQELVQRDDVVVSHVFYY